MEKLVPFFLQLLKNYGYLVILIGEIPEGLCIPFPGETALVTASLYAGATHNLNIILIILFSTISAFIGDSLGYVIGKRKGTTFVKKYGRFIHISEKNLDTSEKYFKEYGAPTVFFGRFTTFLRMFSPLLAGINKMDYITFAAFNFAGCLGWSLVYGIFSFYLGQDFAIAFRRLKYFSIILTGILIVTILIFYLLHRRKKSLK